MFFIMEATKDPFVRFRHWWNEALASSVPTPEAMTLATSTRDGRPSARIVLLKGFDQRGFVFFTNYESRKGNEIQDNPFAALVFYWQPLDRQIRIEGSVERVSTEESRQYFDTRPLGSRLAAWASPQSRVIVDRNELEERFAQVQARFAGQSVALPPFWGGFRVVPTQFEFWSSQNNRLHDRECYLLEGTNWQRVCLAP